MWYKPASRSKNFYFPVTLRFSFDIQLHSTKLLFYPFHSNLFYNSSLLYQTISYHICNPPKFKNFSKYEQTSDSKPAILELYFQKIISLAPEFGLSTSHWRSQPDFMFISFEEVSQLHLKNFKKIKGFSSSLIFFYLCLIAFFLNLPFSKGIKVSHLFVKINRFKATFYFIYVLYFIKSPIHSHSQEHSIQNPHSYPIQFIIQFIITTVLISILILHAVLISVVTVSRRIGYPTFYQVFRHHLYYYYHYHLHHYKIND